MIPVIEHGTVDGVRVLRSDSVTGRTAAALVFRVGRFDESLPNAGITHLVEHLTLSGQSQAGYQFNGEVSGRFTVFLAESGDPADIAGFIGAVSRGLTLDHRDTLEREKRVLRTEAASRGGAGAVGLALSERYGATGPGLIRYEEYGLHRLDWGEIDAWRRYWFVAGNAVLWVHGSLPEGLRIGLPPGPARPMAPLRPVSVGLPGFVEGGRGGIGLSLVAGLGAPASAACDILRERLTRVLRFEHGLSYDVHLSGERLDAGLSHAWLAADALPDQQPMVAHTMLAAMESFADDGGSRAEIDECARRLRDAAARPAAPAALMHRQARDLLCCRPARDPGQDLDEVGALEPAQISAAARELAAGMIVVTPRYLPAVQGRMPRLPTESAGTVAGTEVTVAGGARTLTFGPAGTMLTAKSGGRVTVPAGAVAGLMCFSDGQRALIGADGFTLVLDPGYWPDGPGLVGWIEAQVDPRLRIVLDRPGPERLPPPAAAAPPPGPAAPAPGQPARPARARALSAEWRRYRSIVPAVIAVAGVALLGQGHFWPGIIVALIGLGGIIGFRVAAERRARQRARQRAQARGGPPGR